MNRPLPRWPLYLIASPAAVAVWSGWVGLGTLCGFGVVHPLPGIADGFTINTAITLPIGVEAYGAYALRAWLTPGSSELARKFARWSAVGSLALGMLGQVVYHLLSAAHATRAPWPVVVLVSCLPVVTLGFGAALTHLLHAAGTVADVPDDMAEDVPGPVSVPMLDEAAGTVAVTPGPVADAVVDAVPTPQARATARTVARGRTRRHSPEQRAERAFAGHLEAGSLPSLRAIMRDIKVGQDKARSIRAHLATVAASNRQVANG